jgi:coenzyme PQQ precursor peptide PqqA
MRQFPEDKPMAWTTPTFEEIDLSCEINSYSSAEL